MMTPGNLLVLAGRITVALCTIAKESDMACWRCPKCGEVIYD